MTKPNVLSIVRTLFVFIVWLGMSLSMAHASFPDAVEGEPLPSLAPVLERVTPSVVNISTKGPMPKGNPLMDDPFFRRFFGYEDRPSAAPAQSLSLIHI